MASRIWICTFGERMLHPHSAFHFFLEVSVMFVFTLHLHNTPWSKAGFRLGRIYWNVLNIWIYLTLKNTKKLRFSVFIRGWFHLETFSENKSLRILGIAMNMSRIDRIMKSFEVYRLNLIDKTKLYWGRHLYLPLYAWNENTQRELKRKDYNNFWTLN